jgi:hypothetical protein
VRENIVDMVMQMKFSVNKYSQVFYRVGPGYRGLAKFIIVDQSLGFPGEGYNFSFTDVEFNNNTTETTTKLFLCQTIIVLSADGEICKTKPRDELCKFYIGLIQIS